MAQFTVLRSLSTQTLGMLTAGDTIDLDDTATAERYVTAGYLEPITPPPPPPASKRGKGGD